MKNSPEKIRAYALKNAIAHDGKAQQRAVISSLFHEGLKKGEVKDYVKDISKIVSDVNRLSIEEQKREFDKLDKLVDEREVREGLPKLPGAKKGKIVMRFAPSPSGALHVGHALTASISFDYVMKYGGKFYVRIEDTNPENIYAPAYKLIKKDSEWLFDGKAEIVIQSDRMELYYKYAEKLINLRKVYVCTCSSEKFKEFADFKQECPCRNNDVKENLYRWKKMLNKKGYPEGGAVLRFKSSMQDANPAMRDFPLARINLTLHPRQKNKYRVWPLMNLVVAVDDMNLEMTHIIRGKDHADNAKRQKMIFDVFGKPFPWTFFIGRLKFEDMVLSKRKITEGIKSGEFSGEDDEKLATIISLKKRGYKPEAFQKFAEQRGLTDVDKVISQKDFFKVLDGFNE